VVAEYPADHPADLPAGGAAEGPDRQVQADPAPDAQGGAEAAGAAGLLDPATTARVVEFAVRTASSPDGDVVLGAGDDAPAAPGAAGDAVAAGPGGAAAASPGGDGADDGVRAAVEPPVGTAAGTAVDIPGEGPPGPPVEVSDPPARDTDTDTDVDAAEPAPRRLGRRRARRGPNKREVRHQQTREAIVDAAAALFGERGFDHVSVLEIAQRAGVVEKTVFNHFPVKEGMVFEADPPMRAALLEAVRRRPAGESVAAAAGSFVVAAVSQLGAPAAATGVAEMARVVRGSRTLQTREREILGTLTETLAEQITVETRSGAGDLEPWLAANAVLGLYSALLELARDRVLAGASGPELVEELQTQGQRGLALLQFGLAGYAKRR
jgi:AcrR family transcriptional regulator